MCGIAGVFNHPATPAMLASMASSLAHRGPDDHGIFHDPQRHIGLVHTRLSIIDLSAGGHQPMASTTGNEIVVFNGEIYNYLQIKAELQGLGRTFSTGSDTEVLLEAYQQWGENCVERFEGMFAFALFDYTRDLLFVARDRFGEKPLYYSLLPQHGVLFGSEVRAMLKSGLCAAELDRTQLAFYLQQQSTHFPLTLVKNVLLIPPGHTCTFTRYSFKMRQYWSLSHSRSQATFSDASKTVRDLFIQSVKYRLVSDVPVGAFLSGGIDSTVITGVASSLHPAFNTYTVAFKDAKFEDGKYAAIAARKFNTRHHEIQLSDGDVLQQIPEALNAIDHPSADGINTFIVSKAVRQAGIKVALSGIGGDEVFAGYSSFSLLATLNKVSPLLKLVPSTIRVRLANWLWAGHANIGRKKLSQYLKSDMDLKSNYLLTRQYFFDDNLKRFGLMPFNRLESRQRTGRNFLGDVSELELTHYMHDVLLRDTDQMSMAHALEVRAPFLDSALVDYVVALPDSLKVSSKGNKPLLVGALREFLPDELVHRPKQGFAMPFEHWMKNELNTFCEKQIKFLDGTDLFRRGSVALAWQEFIAGAASTNWARAWLLISLSHWIQKNNIRWIDSRAEQDL